MSIRVLLVDDQPLLRKGFRMILEAEPDLEVVEEAGDGETAVALALRHEPDVVLMDVRMPVMDGIEATEQIVASGLSARILILTTFDLDEYTFAGLRAGASGFLLKDVPPRSCSRPSVPSPGAMRWSLPGSPGGSSTCSPTSSRGASEEMARTDPGRRWTS